MWKRDRVLYGRLLGAMVWNLVDVAPDSAMHVRQRSGFSGQRMIMHLHFLTPRRPLGPVEARIFLRSLKGVPRHCYQLQKP